MAKDEAAILRGVLASCYACEAVPRGACVKCGRLFCGRHGGVRWSGGQRFQKRPLCDDCTPNQTRMRLLLASAIVLMVLVLAFMAAGVVPHLGGDGVDRLPRPVEPPPVRPVPLPG
jgi:hypothetical protein